MAYPSGGGDRIGVHTNRVLNSVPLDVKSKVRIKLRKKKSPELPVVCPSERGRRGWRKPYSAALAGRVRNPILAQTRSSA